MLNINFIKFGHNLTRWVLVLVILVQVLGACSSNRPSSPDLATDGPPSVANLPETQLPANQVPRVEPLSKYGNPKSYEVFGKTYYTLPTSHGYVERGIASWYGKKFHGRLTSSREPYDMYAMTAAHTKLPLPTYVQVTNLKNGKQVVLRVNDRGPFHGNRIIDLSYTAAMKLDIVKEGTGLVEVRALDPRSYRHAANTTDDQSSANLPELEPDLTVNSSGESVSDTDLPSELIVSSSTVSDSAASSSTVSGSTASSSTASDSQALFVESTADINVSEATATLVSGPQVFVQVGAFGERENADQLKNQLSGLNLGVVTVSSVVRDSKPLHRVRIGPLDTVQSADDTVAELNDMGMSDHRVVIE